MDANPNMYPILILPASNTFYFAITHSLITANPNMLNPSSIIHHSSSMATSDIELTQFPSSQFSQYSVDSPPCFTHLLIQSSDPVLKTTHVIGDTVQFETYPAPCILLGMEQTALVGDDEAQRECYEAEFGVPGILPSTAQPPITFQLQLQNQIQRVCICLPPSILSWE